MHIRYVIVSYESYTRSLRVLDVHQVVATSSRRPPASLLIRCARDDAVRSSRALPQHKRRDLMKGMLKKIGASALLPLGALCFASQAQAATGDVIINEWNGVGEGKIVES